MKEQNTHLNKLIDFWSDYAYQRGIKWDSSFLQWNLPATISTSADFSLSLALPIAYKNKCSVQEIAKELARLTVKNNQYCQFDISPLGYINFRFADEYYYQFLKKTVLARKKSTLASAKKVLIEYVSANPTGQLHLGAARNAVIGDTLANVYQYSGYQVIREFYINDRGNQINSLINSVWYFYCEQNHLPLPSNTNLYYQTNIVKEVAHFLSAKYQNNLFKKKNKELLEILRKDSLEFLLTKIKTDLENCGVIFDNWVSESQLSTEVKLTELIEELTQKGLTYHKEGALYLRTTLDGDNEDRVLVKKNGDCTYFLPDILYHKNKLSRADILINVLGADHHGYLARLKAACQLLGHKKERINFVLIQMLTLLTPDGENQKFSKRSGTAINLDEALKWWGKDWLRFTLLSKDPDNHLLVSREQLINDQKDQLHYLQYAHARCHQLLKKFQEKLVKRRSTLKIFPWSLAERKILKNLLRFSLVIQLIIAENKPHHLVHFLTELAQQFQAYYQKENIIDENDLARTEQKILLVKGTKTVLKIGLKLGGISAPNKM